MSSTMVSFRISTNLLQQIDDLQQTFVNDVRLSPSGSTNRTDVMLHLILLGLDELKKQVVVVPKEAEQVSP